MNFENIEGLSDEDVNALYADEEKLVEWYGTFCKTVHADPNSLCVSFYSKYESSGHCALDCASTLTFTAEAMKAKCGELCGGGAELALEANVHKNAHSASYYNGTAGGYCHGCGFSGYAHSGWCYHGHYHSCHEAAWYYAGAGKNYNTGRYWGEHSFHGRHEHPWPIAYARCKALATR